MASDPSRVPKGVQPLYDEIAALTDAVCSDRLGDEYRELGHPRK